MSTITTIRRIYKDSGETTDSHFLRIELKGGEVLRYTDAMSDISTTIKNSSGVEVAIDEVTYLSTMPFDVSAVGSSAEAVGQVDLEGVLLPLGYTREQIAQGTFDNARIYLFISNRNRLVEDEEKLFTGNWSESTLIDGRYISKFSSLITIFDVDTSRVISQLCDTQLGSDRCGVKLETSSRLGEGTTVFDPSSLSLDMWWDFTDPANYVAQPAGWLSSVVDLSGNGTSILAFTDNPQITNIGGVDFVDFTAADSRLEINSGTYPSLNNKTIISVWHTPVAASSPITFFDGRISSIGTNKAVFPYFEDGGTNTNLRLPSSSTSGIAEAPSFNGDFSNPINTTGEGWTAVSGNTYIMVQEVDIFRLESIGANRPSNFYGVTDNKSLLAEILILDDSVLLADKISLIQYLGDKYNVPTPTLPSAAPTISGVMPHDAKTRFVVESALSPYFWFESINNGTLNTSEPNWDFTLGNTTLDNEVEWLAVPARKLALTTQVGQGLDRIINIQEVLPAGFEGVYINGRLEFITGENRGVSFVILDNNLTSLTINMGTLVATSDGDEIEITIACLKSKNYCSSEFRNGTNFQGFDSLPNRVNLFRIGSK